MAYLENEVSAVSSLSQIQRNVLVVIMTAFLFPGFVVGNNFSNVVVDEREREFEKDVLSGKIPVTDKCVAFLKDYIKYAGEFARCELQYAFPFRMCEKCVDEYIITSSTFKDLVTDDDLKECRVKYMMSDRVQVFPLVEKNMENMWLNADCADCFVNLTINHTTKEVNYQHPARLNKFMDLWRNLSTCMNSSLETAQLPPGPADPDFDVCSVCLLNYTALNDHYNEMSSHSDGDVCMDIVDRMNYTRLMWSHHFNCSCRPYEPTAVIVITLFVASFPIFFYIIVRVTGKEKKKKLLKQKRLNLSGRSTNSSVHQSLWRPNNYRNYHSLAES